MAPLTILLQSVKKYWKNAAACGILFMLALKTPSGVSTYEEE